MTVAKLTSTDAFVVTDLDGAETADGIVRCARKVLLDSTAALARSRTYAWALLGEAISGASAAVNAEGDGRRPALEAFAAELAPQVADGSLTLAAGKGVSAEELSGLGEVVADDPTSLLAGLLACAAAALRGSSAFTVAIEHDAALGDGFGAALSEAGLDVVATGADALTTPADVLFVGSRPGVLDHLAAAGLAARTVVPTSALAVTPRALAVAGRAGIVVLPDFLTTSGPLATRRGADPANTLGGLTETLVAHPSGAVLGACETAEEFLLDWHGSIPFGRPIG